jgi:hypothetical protein
VVKYKPLTTLPINIYVKREPRTAFRGEKIVVHFLEVNYGQNLFRISRSGLDFVSRGKIKSAKADRIFLVKELSSTKIISLII